MVYTAICKTNKEMLAIKIFDLGLCLSKYNFESGEVTPPPHPNILVPHCSFGCNLWRWLVMPLISGGSLQSIMASHYTFGIPHKFLTKILKQVLCALTHLHAHGHVHGNIKPGNILVDEEDGSIKLTDRGVLVSLSSDDDDCKCYWTAPELETDGHGYDSMCDIWSFGVTALELAGGRPPVSQLPPFRMNRMLNKLIQHRLGRVFDSEELSKGSKDFSEAFKDMVQSCLVKDPRERPTAEVLLKHELFKGAEDVSIKELMEGVAPLEERLKREHPLVEIRYSGSDMNWVKGWIFDTVGFEFHPILVDKIRFINEQNGVQGGGDDTDDE